MLQCNDECKGSWCCSTGINLCQTEDVAVIFALRGMQIYKTVGNKRFTGYVALYNSRCSRLSSIGCRMNDKKPSYCRNYPDPMRGIIILPSSCCFKNIADEIVEDMENVTEKLLENIK